MKRFITAVAVAVGLGLPLATACSPGSSEGPVDVGTVEKAQKVPCDRAEYALAEIKDLDSHKNDRVEYLPKWGLDPDNRQQIDDVKDALDERVTTCQTGDGSTSGSTDFTADQEVALQDCVKKEDQKKYKPSPDLDDKLLKACKATGATLFESLDQEVRGDKKVGHEPAHFAANLADTTDLQEATYDVRFLKGVKDAVGKGEVISDTKSLAIQMDAALGDAQQGEVRIGTHGPNPVNFAANQNPAGGSGSFTETGDEQFKSTKEIAAYWASGTPKAQTGFKSVKDAIEKAGYGDDEVARAKSGAGYIPIQLKDASQVLGTSYYQDGKVKVLGKWRQAKPGDIYWFFVTKDGKLVLGATLRGKCYNPGITQVVVFRPGMPSAPPVEQPPGEKWTCPSGDAPNPETGRCEPPPPNEECPPGNEIPECAPKSDKAGDYKVPPGKPKAEVPAGQPQGHAQDPAQNETGGRGGNVTDNPTQPTGSESGGTAPGAEDPSESDSELPTGDGEGQDNTTPVTTPSDW